MPAEFGKMVQVREAKNHLDVLWITVPNHGTRSAARKRWPRSRWFKRAQAWSVGCEGRISVLKAATV